MFAFLPTLGISEMLILGFVGLLLYGRDLPDAGRKLGRVVAQLKRGFQDFKDQMDRDSSIREVRRTFEDAKHEMRKLTEVPRAIADPGQAVRNFADDVMHQGAAATPDDKPDEPPPATDQPANDSPGSDPKPAP